MTGASECATDGTRARAARARAQDHRHRAGMGGFPKCCWTRSNHRPISAHPGNWIMAPSVESIGAMTRARRTEDFDVHVPTSMRMREEVAEQPLEATT